MPILVFPPILLAFSEDSETFLFKICYLLLIQNKTKQKNKIKQPSFSRDNFRIYGLLSPNSIIYEYSPFSNSSYSLIHTTCTRAGVLFYVYLFERERECMCMYAEEGRGCGVVQRIQSRLCADSTEPDVGLKLRNCEIMT